MGLCVCEWASSRLLLLTDALLSTDRIRKFKFHTLATAHTKQWFQCAQQQQKLHRTGQSSQQESHRSQAASNLGVARSMPTHVDGHLNSGTLLGGCCQHHLISLQEAFMHVYMYVCVAIQGVRVRVRVCCGNALHISSQVLHFAILYKPLTLMSTHTHTYTHTIAAYTP